MTALVPDECIQCEILLGRRLRDPAFVASIKAKQQETHETFSVCVANYMYAFHKWEHKG